MATLADQLNEQGIRLRGYSIGTAKIICPQCSHTRRNKKDPCLTVTIDDNGATWFCHHCDWTGGAKDSDDWQPPKRRNGATSPGLAKSAPVKVDAGAIPQPGLEHLSKRGISAATVTAAGVGWGKQWFAENQGEAECFVFPYRRKPGGEVVNAKYRTLDKAFSQTKGGEKVFYGLDRLDTEHGESLVIVEGEMDVLSLIEAEVYNGLSVPDGAPKQVKDGAIDPADDRKFEYVWNCRDELAPYPQIILATDADEPGRALAEELARRVGKERCLIVSWPDGCKDANDVLVKHGADILRGCIESAEPYPIKSLQSASAFSSNVLQLYRQGRARGLSTGWGSVSEFYTVAPGHLTVITGIPNSGKSEWLDALTVNLAERNEWKIALCSFENQPEEHIAKLVEKHTGQPFWDGPQPRMSEAELVKAEAWVDDHFVFIRSDDEAPTAEWILETARSAVLRHGVRGLVLDPYNEIEHKRPSGVSETEYVSQMLGQVKRFAQNHGVHVWFVAHPAKLYRDKGGSIPVPSLYDISGSANWVNKADFGIVVHRQPKEEGGGTEIHVRKVRFKWAGKLGSATLTYDPATGVYSEPENYAQRRMAHGDR